MLKSLVASGAVALMAVSFATAAAADSKKASNMLFETPHIASVKPGTTFNYKFERLPSDAKLLGAGYSDQIVVDVESDGAPGKKNVVVRMFTGERGRDPNRITDMDGNPMLVVFLDTALGHFRQLAGGDYSYLKNRMSKSIGSDSTLQPVKIAYNGSDVDGYRVQFVPFANDQARAKMRGYEGSEFSIVVSDKIPGHFVQMIANYKNSQKDAPTLLEKMTLEGVGAIQ